jgi:epoxyqueuosine reductase QueG
MILVGGIGMENMKKYIEECIKDFVKNTHQKTKYREPIVGFADAMNPEFNRIRSFTHEGHLLPQDLMSEGKTIVSFFIPFTKELIMGNKEHPYVSREWVESYIETNQLIREIYEYMERRLKEYKVKVVWEIPQPNFDDEKLMSTWSQRHIAYIAGIGTFGINNLLITEKGCAGRYGSFIIDYFIEPTKGENRERCLFKYNGSCGQCMRLCPVGALSETDFDRHKCDERVWEVDSYYQELDTCDACGKCSLGPCAIW